SMTDSCTHKIYIRNLHDALPISANLSDISISLASAEGFFLANTLWTCSVSFKNSGWENLPVGSLLSKSNDLAGEITIFITIGLKDRKSTRLNSSHVKISYAVFCL